MKCFCISSLMAVCLLLTGCAGTSPFLARNSTLPEGRSVVFGRVNVMNGFEKPMNVPFFSERYTVLKVTDIRPSTLIFNHEIKTADSSFCWSLPPGEYEIVDLKCTTINKGSNWTGTELVYGINGRFSVPSAAKVIYLGDLNIGLFHSAGSKMFIDDKYEASLGDLRSAYPNVQGELTKSLLKLPSERLFHY